MLRKTVTQREFYCYQSEHGIKRYRFCCSDKSAGGAKQENFGMSLAVNQLYVQNTKTVS